VAFELLAEAGGDWTYKVLHTFNGAEGDYPSGLILDRSANLYGIAEAGGPYGGGTAFEVTPEAGGGWTREILHRFGAYGTDGVEPMADLILDNPGNLYGTTFYGGT
jgi:hypothetical protein